MKKLFAAIGILMVVGLTGCNTMRGFGTDVERGGEKVQDAATQQQGKYAVRAVRDLRDCAA